MVHGNGQLWTASTDEIVQVVPDPAPTPTPSGSAASDSTATATKLPPPIQHPAPVRALLPLGLTPLAEPYLLTGAGDVIRVFDVSSPEEPELLAEVDAHWHDVTALRLWMRKSAVEGAPGAVKVEPRIVSASLDGTIRRWRLSGECHWSPARVWASRGLTSDVVRQSYCSRRRRRRLSRKRKMRSLRRLK